MLQKWGLKVALRRLCLIDECLRISRCCSKLFCMLWLWLPVYVTEWFCMCRATAPMWRGVYSGRSLRSRLHSTKVLWAAAHLWWIQRGTEPSTTYAANITQATTTYRQGTDVNITKAVAIHWQGTGVNISQATATYRQGTDVNISEAVAIRWRGTGVNISQATATYRQGTDVNKCFSKKHKPHYGPCRCPKLGRPWDYPPK